MKRLIACVLLMLCGCSTMMTTTIDESMQARLAGSWNDRQSNVCSANYHTISITGDRLLLEYAQQGYVAEDDGRTLVSYTILSEQDSSLRVQLDNESRLDADGQPVIWKMNLLNDSQYCWGRDDWLAEQCIPIRQKCEIL
ncbi:hypothetical protein [Shewanella colwelliana]|uniref:hypothetical protein n=1 Tax=Shewanella colwelliana TaxID=23 RepID=UPI0022AF674C|nr:hypothetical protein [Shewanella colwelliana]MCZ4336618.1 hypothetical protein [Shewanella colwelliana]